MRSFIIIVGILFISTGVKAQQIQLLEKKGAISLRGMSVVNDQVVWVSGSNGMVAKSTDGGKTWRWFQVKGFEKNDFSNLKMFVSHGTVDQVIPVEWARKAPAVLDSLGISNVYKEYPVGHGVAPQNFYDLKNWLEN